MCVSELGSIHYDDVIMSAMASQITSLTIVYSTVYSGADQRKYQSSASLAFVRGIHRGPVNSPHKWPVTRKMFPFDDVIMCSIGNGLAPVPPQTIISVEFDISHRSFCGLSQWEATLHCNVSSHWLRPYTEWSIWYCQLNIKDSESKYDNFH